MNLSSMTAPDYWKMCPNFWLGEIQFNQSQAWTWSHLRASHCLWSNKRPGICYLLIFPWPEVRTHFPIIRDCHGAQISWWCQPDIFSLLAFLMTRREPHAMAGMPPAHELTFTLMSNISDNHSSEIWSRGQEKCGDGKSWNWGKNQHYKLTWYICYLAKYLTFKRLHQKSHSVAVALIDIQGRLVKESVLTPGVGLLRRLLGLSR